MKIHTENIERKVASKKLKFAIQGSQTVTLPSKYRSPKSPSSNRKLQDWLAIITIVGFVLALLFGRAHIAYIFGFRNDSYITPLMFIGLFATLGVLRVVLRRKLRP